MRDKMRLGDLEKNRCYVDQTKPGPYGNIDAPNHVRRFSTALLDNDQTFLQQFNPQNDEDVLGVESHASWRPEEYMEVGDNRETKARAYEVQREALRLVEERVSESTWQTDFFGHYFFKKLQKKFKLTKNDSRASSRLKFYHEYFRLSNDADWNLFTTKGSRTKSYRHADRIKLTMPKPDWAFYFPVHDTDRYSRTIPAEDGRWSWSSRAQDNVIENFSYRVLAELAHHGMVYNTRVDTRSRQVPAKDLCERDLCCFPWLVVEHKKAGEGKENVLCQAANASMAAVMIMEAAARYAEDQEDNKHVLPVASITTVGKDVSAWITYLSKAEDGTDDYKMKLVWTGDMTALVDILQLRIILENLHEWAVRQMKPLLSTYIDQWKFRHSGRGPRAQGSEDTIQRIERAVRRGIDDRMISLRMQDDDETMGRTELAELVDNLLARATKGHELDDSESISSDASDTIQTLTNKFERLFRHYQTTRDATERTDRASLLAEMKSLVGSLDERRDEATKALLAETTRLRETNDLLHLRLLELDVRMTKAQQLERDGVDSRERRLHQTLDALKESVEKMQQPCYCSTSHSNAASQDVLPEEDAESVATAESRSTHEAEESLGTIVSEFHCLASATSGFVTHLNWQETNYQSGKLSTSDDPSPRAPAHNKIVERLRYFVSRIALNSRTDGVLYVTFLNRFVKTYMNGKRVHSLDLVGAWQRCAGKSREIDVKAAVSKGNLTNKILTNKIVITSQEIGEGTAGGKSEDTEPNGQVTVEEADIRSIIKSRAKTLGTLCTVLEEFRHTLKSFTENDSKEHAGKQEFDGGND